MNRADYLRQLKKYLKRLPCADYDSAMEYFTEYFEEAGAEGEQQAIAELGTPKEAAAELLSNLLQEESGRSQGKKQEGSIGRTVWLAVLTVLAAPIGVPLAIAALALLFAGVVVAACGLLCVFLFALSGVLLGGKLVLRSIVAVAASASGASTLAGIGLLSIGVGILLAIAGYYVCKGIGIGCIGLVKKMIHSKGGTQHETND